MDVKINADMNAAIDQIAEKLGTTAKDIVPQYTKLAFVRGVVWTLTGVVLLASPWVALPSAGEGEHAFFVWTARIVLSAAGLMTVASSIENIFAPQAVAIGRLISDIRGNE